jgi:hypothetical protein
MARNFKRNLAGKKANLYAILFEELLQGSGVDVHTSQIVDLHSSSVSGKDQIVNCKTFFAI